MIDSIVGDVHGKRAIVLDDEIATGGSIVELLDRLADTGMHRRRRRLHARPVRRQGRRPAARAPDDHRGGHHRHRPARPPSWPELKVRSVAGLFAEAIARVHAGESVSSLFDGVDPSFGPPQAKLFG